MSWVPITRASMDETQQLLESLLGLTRRTLLASSILKQADGAAFTDAAPRDRKDILAEVLGLDRFDTYLALARADKRSAEDELAKIAGVLERADVELATRDETLVKARVAGEIIEDATTRIADAETRLLEIDAELRNAETARAELRAVTVERDRAEDRIRQLTGQQLTADACRAELETVKDEVESLPTAAQLQALEEQEAVLRVEVNEHLAATTAHTQAKREAELKQAQRDAIAGRARELVAEAVKDRRRAEELEAKGPGVDHCEVCGQTLGAEALASTLASLRTHADELDQAADDLDEQWKAIEVPVPPPLPEREAPLAELERVQVRVREARDASLRAAGLAERMRTLGETIAAVNTAAFRSDVAAADRAFTELEQKVDALTETLPAQSLIERLEHEQTTQAATVKEQFNRRDDAIREKAGHDAQLERLAKLAQDVSEQQKRRDALHGDLDILTVLERAYGRDGIPASIVETRAIPQIEVEANRILGELGTAFRVELRTERALKSGDGTRDTLDVVIITDAGERPYETFSGGERTRINLALRIALARLLAHRRGAESKLLVIDEPEFLDEAGTAALAEVLRTLTEFERVILVSHVPSLRDAFDQTIEVVKDEQGCSRIVGALEAVPA